MNAESLQKRRNDLRSMEKQLRLSGEQLDILWLQARTATGQSKTDLHRKITPLREKQRADRAEHEALKNKIV